MSFDPNDPRITAYVLDELDADERQAFESALSASGDLRQAVEATRQATEQLAGELRTEPLASLSGTQRESVLRAAREGSTAQAAASELTPRPAERRRKWAVFGGAAIAASVLGLCWGGYLLYRAAGERQQVVARRGGGFCAVCRGSKANARAQLRCCPVRHLRATAEGSLRLLTDSSSPPCPIGRVKQESGSERIAVASHSRRTRFRAKQPADAYRTGAAVPVRRSGCGEWARVAGAMYGRPAASQPRLP